MSGVSCWLVIAAITATGCQLVFPYDPPPVPPPVPNCSEQAGVVFDEFAAASLDAMWDPRPADAFTLDGDSIHLGGTVTELATHWFYPLTGGKHVVFDVAASVASGNLFELRLRAGNSLANPVGQAFVEDYAAALVVENENGSPTIRVARDHPTAGGSSPKFPYDPDQHRYLELANVETNWVWRTSPDGANFTDLASSGTATDPLVQVELIAKAAAAPNDATVRSLCSTMPTAGYDQSFDERFEAGDTGTNPNGRWSVIDSLCKNIAFDGRNNQMLVMSANDGETACRINLRQQLQFVSGTHLETSVLTLADHAEFTIELPNRRRLRLTHQPGAPSGTVLVRALDVDPAGGVRELGSRTSAEPTSVLAFTRDGDDLAITFGTAEIARLSGEAVGIDRIGVQLGIASTTGGGASTKFTPLIVRQPSG